MRTRQADVIIVGAGPAGSCAATFLARKGIDVLAVDRACFPREKVCGDGLAPRSVAMLRRLGLEGRLPELGYKPARLYRIVSTWGDAVKAGVPSTFGKGPDYAYVVPRKELDYLLLEGARAAGAQVREGIQALRPVETGAGPEVLARAGDGESMVLRGRVILACDGSRGSFSRSVMPSARLEPYAVAIRAYVRGAEGLQDSLNFFLDRNLLPGYGWIFPTGKADGLANVGLGLKVTGLRMRPEGLRELFDWFMGPSSQAWPQLRHAELVSPPATFPLLLDFPTGTRRLASTLFVGDTANLIDPLSGEGIAYALESGWAAAEAVSRALDSGRLSNLAEYERAVWKGLSMEFLGSYLLRQFLVKPWGNGLVIRLLQRDEGLARGGMGVLSNNVPATWLLKPMVWKKVLAPRRVASTIRASRPAKA